VKVAFLNRERAIQELVEYAAILLEQDTRVLAIGLFGSLARDDALPTSDADVMIVLRSHPNPRWFERIPEFTGAFDGTSLPVETFPYTLEEMNRLASRPGLIRTALRELIHLAGDPQIWSKLSGR
jgi:predicted nucleotidyltransferase